MRIAINTLPIKHGGGLTNLASLVGGLAKVDQKNEYFLIESIDKKQRLDISRDNFKTIPCPKWSTSPTNGF